MLFQQILFQIIEQIINILCDLVMNIPVKVLPWNTCPKSQNRSTVPQKLQLDRTEKENRRPKGRRNHEKQYVECS